MQWHKWDGSNPSGPPLPPNTRVAVQFQDGSIKYLGDDEKPQELIDPSEFDQVFGDMGTCLPGLLTGYASDYYKVKISNPTGSHDAYEAECNDIIEALQMNFAEGNVFKAVWRHAANRMGKGKPGNSLLYDAEKVEFFGKRMVAMDSASN